MKYKISLLLVLSMISVGFSQVNYEWGTPFDFDPKMEIDPQFVLKDNYNVFLLTATNTDGMMSNHKVILRKFDQKNQLVDTYKYDYPKIDPSTLYNYLGFSESDGKVTVYTQAYSGKAKKSVINKIDFDKTTSQFTSAELASTPILSNMKSGNVSLEKSDNKRYVAILYTMHRAKEEAEKNLVLVLEAATGNVVWQKEFSFADPNFTKDFTVTNSGKIVFLRAAKGFKQKHSLVLGTADEQKEIPLESEILLQKLKSVSIGAQDYIFSFNYAAKGVRSGDFENILLLDLQSGKTIQNAKIKEFNNVKGIKEVQISNVLMQNNEIHLFTEAKVQEDIKPAQTSVGSFGGFPEPVIKFGPSHVFVLGFDGTLKSVHNLAVDVNSKAKLYHSFGLVNIKGTNWLNTGNYSGFYALNSGYDKNPNGAINFYQPDPLRDQNPKFINQLATYFPDGNRMLFARVVNDNKMSLVNVTGVK